MIREQEQVDDIPKEFFRLYPIEREISHLYNIEEDYSLIKEYDFSEAYWSELDQYQYYTLHLNPMMGNHNGFYSLYEFFYYLKLKEKFRPCISIVLSIGWKEIPLINNNDYIKIQPSWFKAYNLEIYEGMIPILHLEGTDHSLYNGDEAFKRLNIDMVSHSKYLEDEYSLLDNLITIKTYTRKIKMKNHVIKSVKVVLTVGTGFVSDELTIDVISAEEVKIKKANLQQVMTVDEATKLIEESMVGKKVDEFPKHIRRMMEETAIIEDINFTINKDKLNLFN